LRRRRVAASAALILATAGVLGGCFFQPDGVALARQACVHVNQSLKLYAQAQADSDPTTAATERASAYDQLRKALPLAADATSENGQWNPLMTTIAESARVDESYLVPGLRAQCTFADSNNPELPPNPTTIPPGPGRGNG
jgi:hypothetical protein